MLCMNYSVGTFIVCTQSMDNRDPLVLSQLQISSKLCILPSHQQWKRNSVTTYSSDNYANEKLQSPKLLFYLLQSFQSHRLISQLNAQIAIHKRFFDLHR